MIHSTSIISVKAKIGKNVKIGPFCVVGSDVILEDDIELKSHVVIEGIVKIGSGTVIHPFASIGSTPQILHFHNEPSEVIIGKNNVLREYVTIQPGTEEGGMVTKIGNNCLFMVGVHIGHDCQVGDHAVFANYASLGGHVHVGDHVRIGGLAAVHQRVRIGAHAMVGGVSALVRDLIPYGLATGDRAYVEGLNLVGMKRSGISNNFSLEANIAVSELLTKTDNTIFSEKIAQIEKKYSSNPIVSEIIGFIKSDQQIRNICSFKSNI